ncbi:MAG: hypothetical protein IVW36_10180 [Dehalococcoidia bacterium]|nr:hypothetical protein [Dehalococcoidia bacterium]
MMVAGTAAAVGMALTNERKPQPAFAHLSPSPRPTIVSGIGERVGQLPKARQALNRRLLSAAVIAAAVLALAASVPALSALISGFRSSSASAPPMYGPPMELRSASGVAGDWARAYTDSAPPAEQLGAAAIAGAQETQRLREFAALQSIARQRDLAAQAASRSAASRASVASAAPYSINRASGLAPGAVLRARITIYGCSGPGGGYCNRMSSGGAPFEGAAACSSNLPFGTKLTIDGDPSGRTYECLDRGNLSATWIDVFFQNTADGLAWQSRLGSTSTNIRIVN